MSQLDFAQGSSFDPLRTGYGFHVVMFGIMQTLVVFSTATSLSLPNVMTVSVPCPMSHLPKALTEPILVPSLFFPLYFF